MPYLLYFLIAAYLIFRGAWILANQDEIRTAIIPVKFLGIALIAGGLIILMLAISHLL